MGSLCAPINSNLYVVYFGGNNNNLLGNTHLTTIINVAISLYLMF